MSNKPQSFLSFFGLLGACVELDAMAEDRGFDAGFSAANWADFACEADRCQGSWVDVDGECGEAGKSYPCDDCVRAFDVFASFVEEQLRLLATYDPFYGEEDHDLVLDTKGHCGLGECEHCGNLYQSWNDHECYGTRGEAAEAAMMG